MMGGGGGKLQGLLQLNTAATHISLSANVFQICLVLALPQFHQAGSPGWCGPRGWMLLAGWATTLRPGPARGSVPGGQARAGPFLVLTMGMHRKIILRRNRGTFFRFAQISGVRGTRLLRAIID